MINDQNLEDAARQYCGIVGLDPDKIIEISSEQKESCDVLITNTSKQWEEIAKDIKKQAIINKVISENSNTLR
jgi:hypothetical protein